MQCIEELDALSSNAVARTYTWGLDVAGKLDMADSPFMSMAGAGGVGGLLSMSNSSMSMFYIYDGNGNVMKTVHETGTGDPTLYRYGPYGQTITNGMTHDWTPGDDNPYRFSTKFHETALAGNSTPVDLYDYGFRWYHAGLGRWTARDPLEELGGTNLYRMTQNAPLSTIDLHGLKWVKTEVAFSYYYVTCEPIYRFDKIYNGEGPYGYTFRKRTKEPGTLKYEKHYGGGIGIFNDSDGKFLTKNITTTEAVQVNTKWVTAGNQFGVAWVPCGAEITDIGELEGMWNPMREECKGANCCVNVHYKTGQFVVLNSATTPSKSKTLIQGYLRPAAAIAAQGLGVQVTLTSNLVMSIAIGLMESQFGYDLHTDTGNMETSTTVDVELILAAHYKHSTVDPKSGGYAWYDFQSPWSGFHSGSPTWGDPWANYGDSIRFQPKYHGKWTEWYEEPSGAGSNLSWDPRSLFMPVEDYPFEEPPIVDGPLKL